MKRLLPGAWLAASCGLMSIALLGCPGTLDQGVTGGGGGGGGLGGSGGGGGAAGFGPTRAGWHAPGGSARVRPASANPAARLVGVAVFTDPHHRSSCAGTGPSH